MGVHHLAFRTERVTALSDFYQRAFQFPIVHDAKPRSIWLGIGADAVLMVEACDADEPRPDSKSKDLVAFAVDAEEKIRVRAFALENECFDGETEHTVYLRDPDGRRVAVSTYPLTAPHEPSGPKDLPQQ